MSFLQKNEGLKSFGERWVVRKLCCRHVGQDLLGGQERLERVGPKLAAEAGSLDPTPRQLGERRLGAVHPADAALESVRQPGASRWVE